MSKICKQVLPVIAFMCVWNLQVIAETLTGRTVRVVDGDTIVVRGSSGAHRVRLSGIDAPERSQPWGEAATRELRRQIAGQEVAVDWHKKDRWQRIVGVVRYDGLDVGLALIASGHAWHFRRYAAEQSPLDRSLYAAAEVSAKASKKGLWSDSEPVAPWDWRSFQRTNPARR